MRHSIPPYLRQPTICSSRLHNKVAKGLTRGQKLLREEAKGPPNLTAKPTCQSLTWISLDSTFFGGSVAKAAALVPCCSLICLFSMGWFVGFTTGLSPRRCIRARRKPPKAGAPPHSPRLIGVTVTLPSCPAALFAPEPCCVVAAKTHTPFALAANGLTCLIKTQRGNLQCFS